MHSLCSFPPPRWPGGPGRVATCATGVRGPAPKFGTLALAAERRSSGQSGGVELLTGRKKRMPRRLPPSGEY
jgi:hypothetical protein